MANSTPREAHLEVVTPHQAFADDLCVLLKDMDFHPGQRFRRGSFVVYLKGGDEVAGLLALAGAQESALLLQEQAVMAENSDVGIKTAAFEAKRVRRAQPGKRNWVWKWRIFSTC